MLTTAATWGDAAEVGKLLRCCYITHQTALPALAGAASFGYVEVVRLLLQAGCSASATVPGRPGGKNALHVACDAGQEAAAVALVEAMASRSQFEAKDGGGLSAVELLREADMGGIARRLDAKATAVFDGAGGDSSGGGNGVEVGTSGVAGKVVEANITQPYTYVDTPAPT